MLTTLVLGGTVVAATTVSYLILSNKIKELKTVINSHDDEVKLNTPDNIELMSQLVNITVTQNNVLRELISSKRQLRDDISSVKTEIKHLDQKVDTMMAVEKDNILDRRIASFLSMHHHRYSIIEKQRTAIENEQYSLAHAYETLANDMERYIIDGRRFFEMTKDLDLQVNLEFMNDKQTDNTTDKEAEC
jgi:hypothetical protein